MIQGHSDIGRPTKRKESPQNAPDKHDRRIIWAVINDAFRRTGYSISKFVPGLAINIDTRTTNPFCGYYNNIKDIYVIELLNMDIYGRGWHGAGWSAQKITTIADPDFAEKIVSHVVEAHDKLLSDRIERHKKFVDTTFREREAILMRTR